MIGLLSISTRRRHAFVGGGLTCESSAGGGGGVMFVMSVPVSVYFWWVLADPHTSLPEFTSAKSWLICRKFFRAFLCSVEHPMQTADKVLK